MRKIAFRAWDTKKQMMTGVEFAVSKRGSWLTRAFEMAGEYWKREYTSRLIPMQFVGLKADGKDIYEGDILGFWGDASWVVRWDEYKGKYMFGDGKNSIFTLSLSSLRGKKVIGNIFENPELMNDIRNY